MDCNYTKKFILWCITLSLIIVLIPICYHFVHNDIHRCTTHKIEKNYINPCILKYKNPEKFPNLYYKVVSNSTFSSFNRVMFQLILPPELDFESKLVAASDTIEDVSKSYIIEKYPLNVTIVFGTSATRNITYFECFESSVIVTEMIQMNIISMLEGAYITLIFTEINKNDYVV